MPITEHTVKTRRHTTFYLAAGPENGPLVIFVHGWPEDANVYKFVKLLFRKGDPAREGQRAFTATARRSHRFLGMSPIPDLPRDNDVVTEEDLSIYVSALERNGFFGPSSWYMNHGVNAEYAMTAQNGGYLNMPVLFLNARMTTCANAPIRGCLSPCAPIVAISQKRRFAQAIGWRKRNRLT